MRSNHFLPDLFFIKILIMKTSIYNKKEHTEGYVGEGNDDSKSDIQKEYEKGNDGNVVTSFGQETVAEKNAHGFNEQNIVAKDGLDTTDTAEGRARLQDVIGYLERQFAVVGIVERWNDTVVCSAVSC